jgi:hypothetical protein
MSQFPEDKSAFADLMWAERESFLDYPNSTIKVDSMCF